MRLHHLRVTAFGPFADTVDVDFDGLSEAGLFLLAGPTGAGKSSVLDAVCFALYGDVPGDRGSARRLRCDLAAPGLAPSVVLEATLSGRRFRIERSPAWERPKKRGTGTTVQQASVCILERVDEQWVTLSTRLDETGHLVSRLVGMTLPQFCQVAMLPQGRFQAFLRARSEDRQALLQRVFRTDRFDRVEKHLRDHRLALRRRSTDHEREVADLVARVSEAAGEPGPVGWEDDLSAAVDRGEVSEWAAGLTSGARRATEAARAEHDAASASERERRAGLEAGRAIADLQGRHARARATLDRLAAEEPAHRARREELDAARRAGGVLPLTALAERAATTVARRCQEADAALARVSGLGVDTSPDGLELARADAAEQQARAAAARPRSVELVELDGSLADLARSIEASTDLLGELDARAAVLPGELGEARAGAQAASRAAAALGDAEERVAEVEQRLDAHRRVDQLEPLLARARAGTLEAREALQSVREEWLSVREARLDGMAAEIATALAVGDSCPVCGSADHPHPAVPAPGAPDAVTEKAARRRVDDAEVVLQTAEEELRTLETAMVLAREQAGGGSVPDCEADLEHARGDLVGLRATADDAPGLDARVLALEAEQQEVATRRTRLAAELAAARADETTHRRRREVVATEIDDLLAGTGCETLDELAARAAERAMLCATASRARADHHTAVEAADAAVRAAASAAEEAGFADLDAARGAARTREQQDALARRVEDDDRARARASGELDEPEVARAAAQPAPDLDALLAGVEEAARRSTRAAEVLARRAERSERLDALCGTLGTALEAWRPVREELALASGVAALVDGSSPDNRLRMRLSAYVLAHRLAQVVAAANLRLATMSDHRYSLEHTGQRGAGETRGGLSLLVRDDWSGERRDPATLSGGETFVVSLALALGLADVITQEAGGADLDTLFVDEGFGSLDADTLDDVMDTLDALRDGGRVVGVVSHVPEMRDRIPARLQVSKHRSGSALETTLG